MKVPSWVLWIVIAYVAYNVIIGAAKPYQGLG